MPILSEGKFTHARFLSSNQNWIRAVWWNSDAERYEDVIIKANLENADYVKLLETFSVDEISTMTDQYLKDEQDNFINYVKGIALGHGLLYDPEASENRERLTIKNIFDFKDDEYHTDLLFNIKLNIFELEEVLNSENTELKKQLREAKTPLEAFYIAGKFLYE